MPVYKKLSTKLVKFYAAEMVLALEYMQSLNVVHRDLKPSNLLIDDTFHIKVTDFGTAKEIDLEEVEYELEECTFGNGESDSEIGSQSIDQYESSFDNGKALVSNFGVEDSEDLQRKSTLVGTYCYMSPEMLKYQVTNFGNDIWALG